MSVILVPRPSILGPILTAPLADPQARVHIGFFIAFQSTWHKECWTSSNPRSKHICQIPSSSAASWLTGHSLGGGVAGTIPFSSTQGINKGSHYRAYGPPAFVGSRLDLTHAQPSILLSYPNYKHSQQNLDVSWSAGRGFVASHLVPRLQQFELVFVGESCLEGTTEIARTNAAEVDARQLSELVFFELWDDGLGARSARQDGLRGSLSPCPVGIEIMEVSPVVGVPYLPEYIDVKEK
ncbi:hypothetical protein PAXINDRAFT_14314 [Paxillus involutus ATCC 200175]|uniref:Uncharacterized protein n=1 Tax=Paxillus involutus ATCC 200175 TaxID=664439 RepID=A0A0C9TBI8_PAXIN|nr:hypothetical protein PAXINDRAFT_14314 [Paxillus involutus ATCC 200175]